MLDVFEAASFNMWGVFPRFDKCDDSSVQGGLPSDCPISKQYWVFDWHGYINHLAYPRYATCQCSFRADTLCETFVRLAVYPLILRLKSLGLKSRIKTSLVPVTRMRVRNS